MLSKFQQCSATAKHGSQRMHMPLGPFSATMLALQAKPPHYLDPKPGYKRSPTDSLNKNGNPYSPKAAYGAGFSNEAKPINVKKALPPAPAANRKSQRKKNEEKLDGVRTEKAYRFRLRRMLFPHRRVFSKEEREQHREKIRNEAAVPFRDGKMVGIIERSQELTVSAMLEDMPANFKYELYQFLHLVEEKYRNDNKKKGVKTWENPNFIRKDDSRYIPLAANTPDNKMTLLDIFARGCLNFSIRRKPEAVGKKPEELDPTEDFLVSLLPEARISQFASRMNGSGVREEEFYARYGALGERYANEADRGGVNSHRNIISKFTMSAESKLKARFRQEAKKNKVWGSINAQGLSHIIPPFFVPVDEVLKHLPGYTEEHLDFAFQDRTSVIMRKLCGRTWIRIHGGQNKVEFTKIREAEKTFPQYKPDPSHLGALKKILLPDGPPPLPPENSEAYAQLPLGKDGKPIPPLKWVPVDIIFRKAPPALLNSFKPIFNSPQETLVYFDQMSHQLALTVSGNPENKAELWVKVAWLPDGNDGLDYTNSPLPHVCQEVMASLVSVKSSAQTISSKLKPETFACISPYFPGGLKDFLKAHTNMVTMESGGGGGEEKTGEEDLFYLKWQKRFHENKDLTDEQRLAKLIEEAGERGKGNWAQQQRFKRQIMKKKHSDSPYASSDEDLLRALVEFLPNKTHVTVNEFCQTVVPQELAWWLPSNVVSWFKKFPEIVQVVELEGNSKFGDRACLLRLGVPKPSRALKSEFTEEESIKMMLTTLRRHGSMSANQLCTTLPLVVQDNFSHHRRDLFMGWLEGHPQYFQLIYTDTVRMDDKGCTVHLVPGATMPGEDDPTAHAMPSDGAPTTHASGSGLDVGADDDGDDDDVDPDALGNKTQEDADEQQKRREAEEEELVNQMNDDEAQARAAAQLDGEGFEE